MDGADRGTGAARRVAPPSRQATAGGDEIQRQCDAGRDRDVVDAQEIEAGERDIPTTAPVRFAA